MNLIHVGLIQSKKGILELFKNEGFQLVSEHPHDPTLFTQGLVWSPDGQTFYESSGLYGRSFLQITRPTLSDRKRVDPLFFAEDIALDPHTGDLLQLTWREGWILRWDSTTLRLKEKVPAPQTFSGECWGITIDPRTGTQFVSDGSDTLTVLRRDASSDTLRVQYPDGRRVSNINALAFCKEDGRIYANVWKTTTIVVIDPLSGTVQRTLDIRSLIPESAHMNPEAVANGVAFHPKTGHLWLTGKYWDRMYEIRV